MMKKQRRCWIWAGAIAALAMASGSVSAGQIRIWPTAMVAGDGVQLEEVAEVRGFDAESIQRLSHLTIHNAPTPGGEILIRADDIRTVLADAGEDLSAIVLMGSSRCRVSKAMPPREPRPPRIRPQPKKFVKPERPARSAPPPSTSPPPEMEPSSGTLESALRDYIHASFPKPDARLEIRFSPARAEDLRTSADEAKFEVRSRDDKKLGLRSFEAVVRQSGRSDRAIPIVAEVTLIEEVVVAKRAINRGETIEGPALRLEERRFTDLAEVGLTDLTTPVGQQCRGFLRPGEMITAESIEQRPVVVRGQPVTIWMRQGALAIRTTGKAQQSGGLGDRIEVLRDGAKRKQDLMEAIVSGPGTVSIGSADQLALR